MTPLVGVVRLPLSLHEGVAGRTSTEEVNTMTEVPPGPSQTGGKTLGVKFSDETHAQLVLIAGLEQVSLADAIRQAVDAYLELKRGDTALIARAAEAAQEVEREAALRRDALTALFGAGIQPDHGAGASRRRGKEQPAT